MDLPLLKLASEHLLRTNVYRCTRLHQILICPIPRTQGSFSPIPASPCSRGDGDVDVFCDPEHGHRLQKFAPAGARFSSTNLGVLGLGLGFPSSPGRRSVVRLWQEGAPALSAPLWAEPEPFVRVQERRCPGHLCSCSATGTFPAPGHGNSVWNSTWSLEMLLALTFSHDTELSHQLQQGTPGVCTGVLLLLKSLREVNGMESCRKLSRLELFFLQNGMFLFVLKWK